MDLRERRDLMNGFGDGLAVAIEIALAPAVFGGVGWLIDRWLGLFPIFTIALCLFGFAGIFTRMWFTYDEKMKEHEQAAVWGTKPAPRTPVLPASDRAGYRAMPTDGETAVAS